MTTKGMWVRAGDVKPGWRLDFCQGSTKGLRTTRPYSKTHRSKSCTAVNVMVVRAVVWVGRGCYEIRTGRPDTWIRCNADHYVWVTSRRRAKAWQK